MFYSSNLTYLLIKSAQHIFSLVLLSFLHFEALSQKIHLGGNTVPPLIELEPVRKDFWQSSSSTFFLLLI